MLHIGACGNDCAVSPQANGVIGAGSNRNNVCPVANIALPVC